MSRARVIVLSVVRQGLSQAEAARRYRVSWRWVHTLITRFHAGGMDALEPRTRRPVTNPRTIPAPVRQRVIELRGAESPADGRALNLNDDSTHT